MSRLLPVDGIFDTVTEGAAIHRTGWLTRLLCKHPAWTWYKRVDHRHTTPDFADVYEWEVCTHCGAILHETKVY